MDRPVCLWHRRGVPARDPSPRRRLLAALDRLTDRASALDVGIDALLATAGVAKASLYGHFGSKDALVVAWLEERQARWFGFFDAYVADHAAGGPPAAALDAAFGFLEEWFARPDFAGCPFVATFLQLKDATHPAAAVARAYAERLREFFRRHVGTLDTRDAEETSGALLELFVGAVVMRQMGVTRAPAAAARLAAGRLLAGAGNRRAPGRRQVGRR